MFGSPVREDDWTPTTAGLSESERFSNQPWVIAVFVLSPVFTLFCPNSSSLCHRSCRRFCQRCSCAQHPAAELDLPGKLNAANIWNRSPNVAALPPRKGQNRSLCCVMRRPGRPLGLPSNTSNTSSSACRMLAASVGNKAEVYWCCCRITFEIASLFCVFFSCW